MRQDALILPNSVEWGAASYAARDAFERLSFSQKFRLLLGVEDHPDYLQAIHAHLSELLSAPSREAPYMAPLQEGDIARGAALLRSAQLERSRQLAREATSVSREGCVEILRHYLPVALTQGRLLQYAANSTVGHTPVGHMLLKLFSYEMGYGTPDRSPEYKYKTLFEQATAQRADVFLTKSWKPDGTNEERRLELPVFLLSLSLFPRIFLPELLGAALGVYSCRVPSGLLAVGASIEGQFGKQPFLSIDDGTAETAAQLDVLIKGIEEFVVSLSQTNPDDAARCLERIATGARLYMSIAETTDDGFGELTTSRDGSRAEQVARIFASRTRKATGSHTSVRLGNESLEELLAPETFEPQRLLRALASSTFVVPGNSAASPLIRSTFSIDGPMFRVFSDAEVQLIREWIDGLPDKADEPVPARIKRSDRATRVRGDLSASVLQGTQEVRGEVVNISRSGALLRFAEPVVLQDRCDVRLVSRGTPAVDISCPSVVRRCPNPTEVAVEFRRHHPELESIVADTPVGTTWYSAGSADYQAAVAKYSTLTLGQVVRRLLDVEMYPDVRIFAHHFLSTALGDVDALVLRLKELKAAGLSNAVGQGNDVDDPDFFSFRPYSTELLDELMDSQEQIQKGIYERWSRNPMYAPYEAVRNRLGTIVTLSLIDGAWLQYASSGSLLHDRAAYYLHQIYEDELGNGLPEFHHGNMMRRLGAQLELDVPDVLTSEFGSSRNQAYVPLLWLSISLFPQRLRPELLGLTLAIESQGVGGAYRIGDAMLGHHGLETALPRIHNSIDNFAEGHTGWSKEAVNDFLLNARSMGGDALCQALWARAWKAYTLWSVRQLWMLEPGHQGPLPDNVLEITPA